MDINKRNKILIIAVIFLAVLNIATIGSIFYHIHRMRQQPIFVQPASDGTNRWHRLNPLPPQPPEKRPGSNRDTKKATRFRHIMDEIGLSDEQRQYFLSRRQDFFRTHRPLMDSLRFYHSLLDSLACSPEPDSTLIVKYSHKIARLHYRFTLDYTLLINDWYKQCTPGQLQRFCKIFNHKKFIYRRYHNYNSKK